MSLIIENKDDLNALANAIIGANGSNTQTSATKSELEEMINNIIPEKAKFASGTFTPTVDITTDNGPWVDFSLGTDNDGNRIIPNLIFAFQPYVLQSAEIMDASCYRTWTYGVPIVNPVSYSRFVVWNCNLFRRTAPSSSSSIYYTGYNQNATVVGEQETSNYTFTKNKFKLQPINATYPFLAGHPIVWLQIKF